MTVNDIQKYLREKEADFSDVSEETLAGLHLIKVEVEWGDWKHSHGYLDYLMGQVGYLLLNEEETEEDGSDCYSSIHTFYDKNDASTVNAYKKLFK